MCRVAGSGLYLLTYVLLGAGLIFMPSGVPAGLPLTPDTVFTVLMFGSVTGASLFAIGYLAGTMGLTSSGGSAERTTHGDFPPRAAEVMPR